MKAGNKGEQQTDDQSASAVFIRRSKYRGDRLLTRAALIGNGNRLLTRATMGKFVFRGLQRLPCGRAQS
ncbi:MAG: hypothetical protein JNG88_15960 [Phycisphaerales bacterium]|nr:hypothetical protein [Phycisphaerales bacterium]